jgi:hypothetical protein
MNARCEWPPTMAMKQNAHVRNRPTVTSDDPIHNICQHLQGTARPAVAETVFGSMNPIELRTGGLYALAATRRRNPVAVQEPLIEGG